MQKQCDSAIGSVNKILLTAELLSKLLLLFTHSLQYLSKHLLSSLHGFKQANAHGLYVCMFIKKKTRFPSWTFIGLICET